jgi:meso-butanediol dehydrogenase / (S,S)-butanediol dehydrogenase / diacetyl reductase
MPSSPSFDFHGVRALVTGGARGLGNGIVRSLADWGAQVAMLDRDTAEVEAARAELAAGAEVFGVVADVTDEEAVERGVDFAVNKMGGLDLLVNNAGVLTACPVVEMALADWRRIMDVNATGTFLMSRTVARFMIAAGIKGSIISISSIAGKIGDPLLAHYCASKFAVVGFTQALARELGRYGINVNAICPGVVATQMIRDLAAGSHVPVEQMLQAQIVKRPQEAAEIAMTIAFLHANRSVTGQSLNIDGGTVFH